MEHLIWIIFQYSILRWLSRLTHLQQSWHSLCLRSGRRITKGVLKMNICLATYENRIASLLETSNRLFMIQPPNYDMECSYSIPIMHNTPNEIVRVLRKNQATTLICGAVSGCVQNFFKAQGLEIIPWITGEITEVIHALRTNSLQSANFIMPGCRKHGRFRHGDRWNRQ